jgi:hypothetical protein
MLMELGVDLLPMKMVIGMIYRMVEVGIKDKFVP